MSFFKRQERVLILQCLVDAYVGDNIFIGDDPKGWPYGIIDRHNQLEEVCRSRHRDEPLVSVVHRCALDPIDGLWYCERELSFALASREGEDPAVHHSAGNEAGGSVINQPPSPHGAAGFISHEVERVP